VGKKPMICVPIVSNDPVAIKKAEPLADLFEVRIDLIGTGWREVTAQFKKPWLACNRRAEEGGKWRGSEEERVRELLNTAGLGAGIIDVELSTPGLAKVVKEIKGKAVCLISYHNNKETPREKLYEIVRQEQAAGADICKVVTTARNFADNIAMLQLIQEFPGVKVVALAMGAEGQISRVLCPLVGGYFTYASISAGQESGAGQIAIEDLKKIYGMLGDYSAHPELVEG
jgi:3-dehydroquinate dehydratase type I